MQWLPFMALERHRFVECEEADVPIPFDLCPRLISNWKTAVLLKIKKGLDQEQEGLT